MVQRVLVASTLLLIACGPPRIRLEWSRPAQFTLPLEKPVSIKVEADGTPPGEAAVVDAVISFGQGQLLNKWVAVPAVKGELELQLRHAGHTVVSEEAADLIVQVTPTRWSYQANNGGRLEASVRILDAKNPGAQPLYADGYWATGGSGRVGEPEALARAARGLAGAFLRTLQPQRVSARVELDDTDPATEVGVGLCMDNQFEAAYLAFSDAATKYPESAPVLYDLAVLAEARGEYDLAESMLAKATQLKPKKLYYSALDRVRNARVDAEAMKAR